MNKGLTAVTKERQEFESWPDENRPTFPDPVLNIVIHCLEKTNKKYLKEKTGLRTFF